MRVVVRRIWNLAGKFILCLPDLALEEDDDKHNLKKGMTAVHIAARFGREKIMKYMLQWGADLEAQDRLGNTPLHHAVIRTGVRYYCVVCILYSLHSCN